jgi:hypothetical protein
MEGLGRSARYVGSRGPEVRTNALEGLRMSLILASRFSSSLPRPMKKFETFGGAAAVMHQQDCDPPR